MKKETLDEIVLNIGLDGRRRMAKSEGCVVFHQSISNNDVGMFGRLGSIQFTRSHSFFTNQNT